MLRKVAIAAVVVFITDSFLQVLMSMFLLVWFLLAHVVVRPFAPSVTNTESTTTLLQSPSDVKVIRKQRFPWLRSVDEMNFLETLSLTTTFVTMMGST